MVTLRMRGFPVAQPGQFVHLIPGESNSEDQNDAPQEFGVCFAPSETGGQIDLTVRRAFSIAGLRRSGDHAEIDILYRVVGKCTRWMSGLSVGGRVNVLGPVGNLFTVSKGKKLALLVAGGVGLPPMICQSR